MKKKLLLLPLCFISPCIQASSLPSITHDPPPFITQDPSPFITQDPPVESLYGLSSFWEKEQRMYGHLYKKAYKNKNKCMLVNGYIRAHEYKRPTGGSAPTPLLLFTVPIYLKRLIFSYYFLPHPTNELKKLWRDMFFAKNTTDSDSEKIIHTISYLIIKYPRIVNMQINGSTALIRSISKRERAIIKALLERGASINKTNKDGESALHIACRLRWTSGVALLLKKGADINLQNNHGNTPLIVAAQAGWASIVTILLRKGASTDLKNREGKNIIDIACENKENYDSDNDDDIGSCLIKFCVKKY